MAETPAPAAPVSTDLRGVPPAVAMVQAILDREKAPPPEAPAAETPPAPAPEAEYQPADNKQPEAEEVTQASAEIPLDQLEAIELEVVTKGEDGSDVKEKLPIKALREGYMKEKDYRRKTTELARQREQLREETRKAVETERANALKELQTMHDLVTQTAAAELGNVDWNDLSQNNAFEYVRLDNRRKQITQTLETIRAKQKEVLTKHQEEQAKAMREAAEKARTQLESDIPGFNDALYQTLLKAGIERYGYKQEEVTSWIDPRAIKLLHKAHLYDQLQAEKKAPPSDKKVVVPPKVVKPGAVQDVSQARQQEQGAMKRLQTSGKLDDAAAVIRSRFG